MSTENMTDKMPRMTNDVKLTGRLAELTVANETSQKGVPYIRIRGAVQYGNHKAQTQRFEAMAMQYTEKDGKKTENKAYDRYKTWVNKAVPMTKVMNAEEATECTLVCNIEPNDYVAVSEELVETTKYIVRFFNDKAEEDEYGCHINIGGYIHTIAPEMRGEEETGRLRVSIISNTYRLDALPIKNIIIPAELRDDFDNGYEIGQTVDYFSLDYILKKGEKKEVVGGIGKPRVTEGRSYCELILVGAKPALDEDDEKVMQKSAVSIAMKERKAKLEEIKEKGYQGGKTEKKDNFVQPVTDDDIPF